MLVRQQMVLLKMLFLPLFLLTQLFLTQIIQLKTAGDLNVSVTILIQQSKEQLVIYLEVIIPQPLVRYFFVGAYAVTTMLYEISTGPIPLRLPTHFTMKRRRHLKAGDKLPIWSKDEVQCIWTNGFANIEADGAVN
jgi:hypothetical protein